LIFWKHKWVEPAGLAQLKKCGKKSNFWGTVRMNSGVLPVARGGSGAKANPLAARPNVSRLDHERNREDDISPS